MRIRTFCLTLISALVFSYVASAYELMGLRWSSASMPVAWQLDNAGSIDVTDGSELQAVKDAAQAWGAVSCSHLTTANPTALTGPRSTAADSVNMVYWIEQAAEWTYGKSTLGVTLSKHYPNGEMFDADIVFNGVDWDWTTGDGYSCPSCVDVSAVALHEFGHFYGLDHSPTNSAVMYESYQYPPRRTLSTDDIDGICALYPTADAGTGLQGSTCQYNAACKAPLLCAVRGSDSEGVCSSACLGPNDTTCPAGSKCKSVANGQHACLFGADEGETCSEYDACAVGLDCVRLDGSGFVCRRRCDPQQGNNTCPSDFECQSVGTGGVCTPRAADACEECQFTTDCSPGLECVVDADNQSRCRTSCSGDSVCGGERCVSKGSRWACSCPGLDPKIEGEGCAASAECAENAVCVADGTSAGSVCRTVCNPQSPACPTGKACVEVEGTHVCTRPAADTTQPEPEPTPEAPVAHGCGCAAPLDLAWFAPLALMLRLRKRR